MQLLTGTKRRVENLSFSADGVRLAAGGVQGPVEVWDTSTGERTHSFDFAAIMGHSAIHFHPDGTLFLGCVGGLRRFHLTTNTHENCMNELYPSHQVALAPDGSFVLTLLDGTIARLACAAGYRRTWKVPIRPPGHTAGAGCTGLAVLPDTDRFVSLEYYDRSAELEARFPNLATDARHMSAVAVRDCATGKVLQYVPGPAVFAERPAVSPDGSLVAVIAGRSLYVFHTEAFAEPPVKLMNEVNRHFTGVAFHPSGEFLAAASNDTSVKLYNTVTWKQTRAFTWKLGRMRCVCFSPDGLRLAAGAEKGQVVVWDMDV